MTLPQGAAAAVAALSSGLLGSMKIVKIGDLVVSGLTGLSGASQLNITNKPTGAGYSMTDAAVFEPLELTLDIVFANPQYSAEAIAAALLNGEADSLTEGWQQKKDELYAMQYEREIVVVQTQENIYPNMLIKIIDPVYDADNNWDGFMASVTVHQINPVVSDGGGGLLDSVNEAVSI